jgi:hypothetical protein
MALKRAVFCFFFKRPILNPISVHINYRNNLRYFASHGDHMWMCFVGLLLYRILALLNVSICTYMYLHIQAYLRVSTQATPYWILIIYVAGVITRRYMYLRVSTHIQVYLRVSTHIQVYLHTISRAFHVRFTCVSRAILAIDLNHKSARISLHI